MIFDRTSFDVEKAKVARAKLQKGESLSDSDVLYLERGTLTINTLNRIEEKQAQLKKALDDALYFSPYMESVEWENGDIFKESDFFRIIANDLNLRNAFYVLDETPEQPAPRFHYTNINDIEKILADIEFNLDYMISHFRQCGATQCGE